MFILTMLLLVPDLPDVYAAVGMALFRVGWVFNCALLES